MQSIDELMPEEAIALFVPAVFAAFALGGLCANSIPGMHQRTGERVKEAWELGDLMMDELKDRMKNLLDQKTFDHEQRSKQRAPRKVEPDDLPF